MKKSSPKKGTHGRHPSQRKARGAKVSERPVAEVKLNPVQKHKTPAM